MKKTFTKKTCFNRSNKLMTSGGWGKYGPYGLFNFIVFGAISIGCSFGTKGRQIYFKILGKKHDIGFKHNMESGSFLPNYKKRK